MQKKMQPHSWEISRWDGALNVGCRLDLCYAPAMGVLFADCAPCVTHFL